MRQLTAFASYFDNLGALLIGRVRFCNIDGSPAEVFHKDSEHPGEYVSGGSSVFTNSSGQLEPQVFLADHDYLILFDKYIGDGRMTEDEDDESWEEQGSAVDKYNTIGITLEGASVRSIETISSLRSTVPGSDNEIVLLLGYNSAGDKEPIFYKWNPNAASQDNGGSIIKVTQPEEISQGRWVLYECPEYLDVRHFGAFPQQELTEDQGQKNAIQLAYNYTHALGRKIYFYANLLNCYYDISGLILVGIDAHPMARLFCKTSSSATLSEVESVRLSSTDGYLGQITLAGQTVKTSWGQDCWNAVFQPQGELIMDAEVSSASRSWSGITVCIQEYTEGCFFDGCEIYSDRKIDDTASISNCEVKGLWFDPEYDWADLSISGCGIYLKNFSSADDYITLKNKQGENNYGNLGGMTASSVSLLAGCSLESAVLDGAVLLGSATLRNVRGTFSSASSNANLKLVGCELTLEGYNGTTTATFASLDCSESSFASSLTKVSVNGAAAFSDSTVSADLETKDATMFVNCEINGNVNQFPRNYEDTKYRFRGEMRNCNLYGTHTLDGGVGNSESYVEFKWINNWSNNRTPIAFSNALIPTLDTTVVHGYVYKGNTGTFLAEKKECVTATSYSTNSLTAGWYVVPTFPDAAVFIVGKRKVKISVHVDVNSISFGVLEGSATKVIDLTSGYVTGDTIKMSVQMPDIVTPAGTMKDFADASPNSALIWASIDVL